MLTQRLNLERYFQIRVFILIHFADLKLNFFKGLPKGNGFGGLDVGDDHL
jgi:hypothetical protein